MCIRDSPRVVQVYPSDGMEYVPVDTSIHIVFSEPMDEDSTISAISISPAPDFSARSWQFLHDNSCLLYTSLLDRNWDARLRLYTGIRRL